MRHDGLFRNDQSIIALTKHSIDARKHTGAQLHLSVVNTTPHTHRAAIGIDQGINGLDDSGEFTARQGIHGHLRFLPWFDFGLEALRQTEIKQHSFNVLHVDHVGAIFQIVTHVNLPQACGAIERRKHFQALQSSLRQCQFGLCNLKRCIGFIQRSFADEVLRDKLLIARVVGLSDRQLGLGLSQLGGRQLIVKLDQDLSLFNFLSVLEQHLADTPAHLGSQHHTLK